MILIGWPLLLVTISSSWIFTSTEESIDPFVYTGYFHNLTQHLQVFSGTYYGARLPWILPGYLVNRLLPPLIANYVLHIGLYYVGILSLYFTLKNTLNMRTALLTSLLMGSYSYFLWAVGWDYVDGAGIAYFLLSMAMLTWAAKRSRWRLALVLAGSAMAAMVYTHLLLTSLVPVLMVYFFFTYRQSGEKPLGLYGALLLAGALLLTVILGAINQVISGEFLFFMPQVTAGKGLITSPNPWAAADYEWLAYANWLVFPLVTLLGSLMYIILRQYRSIGRGFGDDAYFSVEHNPHVPFFCLQFILISLVFVTWQLAGNPVLHLQHAASYLIPGMFLAVGSLLAVILSRVNGARYPLLVASVIIISLVAYTPSVASQIHAMLPKLDGQRLALWPLALVLIGLLVLRLMQVGVRALSVFFFFIGVANIAIADLRPFDFTNSRRNKESYLTVVKAIPIIQGHNPDGSLRFWYSYDEPYGGVYRAVASTHLWAYRLVNEEFPSTETSFTTPIEHNDEIVILSSHNKSFAEAKEALREIGLIAQFVAEESIQQGEIRFTMTFIKVSPSSGRTGELTHIATSFFSHGGRTGTKPHIVDDAIYAARVRTSLSIYD